MSIKRDIVWRVAVMYTLVFIVAVCVVFKVLKLQWVEADRWKVKGMELMTEESYFPAERGEIFSEDGDILACSIPYFDVRMDLVADAITDEVFQENVDSLAFSLSKLFKDKTPSQYLKDLKEARKKRRRDYQLGNRRLDYIELEQLKGFPILNRGRIRGGLKVTNKVRRLHPYQMLGLRTLGTLQEYEQRKVGIVGLEGAYESELKGVDGMKVKKYIGGEVRDFVIKEPQEGNDVMTTIDINVQDVAETALLRSLKQFEAQRGCAIVMEVSTGEIKAMANLSKVPGKDSAYFEDYNFAIGGAAEPGSVFKIASMLALLEDGKVSLKDSIDTGNGVGYFYGAKLTDSRGYGKISISEVIELSSNVGIAKLVNRAYKDNPKEFVSRLYDLHLHEPLGVKIKGEGKPLIKYPGDKATYWSGITLPWMSVGYETKVTPLQMLTLYNTIANDGVMLRPKIVKAIMRNGVVKKDLSKPEVMDNKICSSETIKMLQDMLVGVVQRGTAKKMQDDRYQIAGKTGTARMAKSGGYSRDSYRASFIGYFPAESPRYSCAVVIEEPLKSKGYYGGSVAAPVLKEIADELYAKGLLKTPVSLDSVVDKSKLELDLLGGAGEEIAQLYEQFGKGKISKTEKFVRVAKEGDFSALEVKETVPSFVGVSLKDALFLLEGKGVEVEIKGVGKIVKQSVKGGTALEGVKKIVLTLS